MKQNEFYEVDGCMDFIPVKLIEEHKHMTNTLEVEVVESGLRTLARNIYRFPKVDEPQKPVVPKFVAEWVGYCKFNRLTLLGAFDPVSELGVGLVTSLTEELRKGKDWAQRNQETFARAWLDGYEIEQEKLYTVTIPNPNRTSFPYTLYRKADGKMTEKLGVLLRVPKLEPLVDNEKDFLQIVLLDRGKLTIHKDELSEELCNAYKCTQEEAKKYPQFRWVALEDLE